MYCGKRRHCRLIKTAARRINFAAHQKRGGKGVAKNRTKGSRENKSDGAKKAKCAVTQKTAGQGEEGGGEGEALHIFCLMCETPSLLRH